MAEPASDGPSLVNNRAIEVYPLDNYTFGTKAALPEKDKTITERFLRLRKEYLVSGMRRTVEAVIVTHQHNMPHVLLLKIGSTFFKLPGGILEEDEDEIEGLKRILSTYFGQPSREPKPEAGMDADKPTEGSSGPFQCEIRDVVSNWWRPHFEPTQYPYIPAHVTKPKEHRRLLLVELPPFTCFKVPNNYTLLAAPLFELFDNHGGYGPVISSLALSLSKFNFVYK